MAWYFVNHMDNFTYASLSTLSSILPVYTNFFNFFFGMTIPMSDPLCHFILWPKLSSAPSFNVYWTFVHSFSVLSLTGVHWIGLVSPTLM
jgi:hypothetical protein